MFNFAANNPLLLLRSRSCFYFPPPFPCIHISLLLFTTTTWLSFWATLLLILLLLNYLALNSGSFYANIHSKRAIHNHNNQRSLEDTEAKYTLLKPGCFFCCSPILTLIPRVSIHCPSVLVTLSKAPTTSGTTQTSHVLGTCLNNLISQWMFISQSSFTSLFSDYNPFWNKFKPFFLLFQLAWLR